LSPTEAELLSVTKGATEGLFLKKILLFLVFETVVGVKTDNSGAKALANKTGPGRLKHVETQELFVQGLVSEKKLRASKAGTDDNNSDVLTKYIERFVLERHRPALGLIELENVVEPNVVFMKTKGKRRRDDDERKEATAKGP
jgi:hypothetical protein